MAIHIRRREFIFTALPRTAAVEQTSGTADSCHIRTSDLSFDHLVGDGEQRRQYGEAEHPRDLMVDDPLDVLRDSHETIGDP